MVCRSLQKEYFKSVGTALSTGYRGVQYSGQLECSGSEAYPENCNFQFSPGSCRNALTVDCTEGRLSQCTYCVLWGVQTKSELQWVWAECMYLWVTRQVFSVTSPS